MEDTTQHQIPSYYVPLDIERQRLYPSVPQFVYYPNYQITQAPFQSVPLQPPLLGMQKKKGWFEKFKNLSPIKRLIKGMKFFAIIDWICLIIMMGFILDGKGGDHIFNTILISMFFNLHVIKAGKKSLKKMRKRGMKRLIRNVSIFLVFSCYKLYSLSTYYGIRSFLIPFVYFIVQGIIVIKKTKKIMKLHKDELKEKEKEKRKKNEEYAKKESDSAKETEMETANTTTN